MSLNNLILCWRTGDDYYFRLLFTEPPFKIIKNTQGFLRDGYFPNHGSFFNIPTVYESLRSTKILGVYLFKINIYSGTYRYPEFAGISNSLTDIATGNRRVICLINSCGRYLMDLKYRGLAFFVVLIHT